MIFDGSEAALAALQNHTFIEQSPYPADADQAGPMLDAAMLAGTNFTALAVMEGAAFMAAPEQNAGDLLIASLMERIDAPYEAMTFARTETNSASIDFDLGAFTFAPLAFDDWMIIVEPSPDLEWLDGTQQTEEPPPPPIVVTGTRPRNGTITIMTDTGRAGDMPVPGDTAVITEITADQPTLTVGLEGRECPADRAAAKASLQSLYDNSPTARGLIDSIAAKGFNINLIAAHISGTGAQPSTAPGVISWDPFLVIQAKTLDGSVYTLTPIMILAHELVHAGNIENPAYQTHASEPIVMPIANQIALEMNKALGSNYSTNRDNHGGPVARYYTHSSTSQAISIVRPGCP